MVYIVSHNKTATKNSLPVKLRKRLVFFFIAQETNEFASREFRCNGNCILLIYTHTITQSHKRTKFHIEQKFNEYKSNAAFVRE